MFELLDELVAAFRSLAEEGTRLCNALGDSFISFVLSRNYTRVRFPHGRSTRVRKRARGGVFTRVRGSRELSCTLTEKTSRSVREV